MVVGAKRWWISTLKNFQSLQFKTFVNTQYDTALMWTPHRAMFPGHRGVLTVDEHHKPLSNHVRNNCVLAQTLTWSHGESMFYWCGQVWHTFYLGNILWAVGYKATKALESFLCRLVSILKSHLTSTRPFTIMWPKAMKNLRCGIKICTRVE